MSFWSGTTCCPKCHLHLTPKELSGASRHFCGKEVVVIDDSPFDRFSPSRVSRFLDDGFDMTEWSEEDDDDEDDDEPWDDDCDDADADWDDES